MINIELNKAKVIFQGNKDQSAQNLLTPLTQEYLTLLATGGDTTAVQAEISAVTAAKEETDYLAATSASDLLTYWPPVLGTNPFVPPTPTGIIFTGRGSGGLDNLNVSYYVEFDEEYSLPSQTELYIPGTDTTIAYGSGGPGQFASSENCFSGESYQMQIRDTYSKVVITEFEVPLNPTGENVAF